MTEGSDQSGDRAGEPPSGESQSPAANQPPADQPTTTFPAHGAGYPAAEGAGGYQPTQSYEPVSGEPGDPSQGYGGQPSQQGYGQSAYGQQQGYGQPGYGQPGYGTQSYPGYQPAGSGKSHRGLWLGLLALVVVLVVAAVLVFAVFKPFTSGKKLSHTAVEQYIETHLGVADVTCNGGKDFPMTANGATFTCTSADGHTFTVQINNKNTGLYTVS